MRPTDREDVQITEKAPNKGLSSSKCSLPPMSESFPTAAQLSTIINNLLCYDHGKKPERGGESERGGKVAFFLAFFAFPPSQ